MSEAPAEMWVRPDFNICRSAPFADAVRYVRADLYEALQVREIELERLLDFLGERPITRDNCDYHV